MNQAGLLASLISGILPVHRMADSGFILPEILLHGVKEQSYSCASARDLHTVPF